MKEKLKQYLPVGAIVVGSILLLSLLSYIGFKSENVQQTTNEKTTKMQYVLVNEDKGTTFEGKKYSLGTDFVTLINQDNQNRWETTTRDIATRGIEDGQFDAQIIIPQDFSERLLSLQSISPEQALVEYQVREGQNEVTNQAIQTKVNDILKDFNQRIVQMYFSSIIGNLSDAQQNVNQMVGLENTHQNTLEKDIYLPFKDIPTNFTSVSDTASILDEENKVFTKEQEAFVEAVKSLMETNNNGLEENSKSTEEVQKSVNDYADEANEKLETSIQQFNDQFELQKEQLELQWGNDLSNYKNQYDLLNTSIGDQLGLFYTPGSSEETSFGVYADFLKNANEFYDSQGKRIDELGKEIKDLETQVDQLTNLKKDIAIKYFSSPENTPEKVATDNTDVKLAISALFGYGENESEITNSGTGKNYLLSINDGLQALNNMAIPNSEDLDNLLSILINNYNLDPVTAGTIKDSYTIVTSYDTRESKDTDGNSTPILNKGITFELGNPSMLKKAVTFNPSSMFTIDIQNTGNQKFTFSTDSSTVGQVTVSEGTLKSIANEVTALVNSELDNQGSTYHANSSVSEEDQSFTITIDDTAPDSSSSIKPTAVTLSKNLSYEITWLLDTTKSDAQEFYSTNYSWNSSSRGTLVSNPLSLYIDRESELKSELPDILKLFNQLTSTAEKITMVYADPESNPDDLSIQNFAAYISTDDNKTKLFKDLAAKNSFYKLYNNLTEEKAKNTYIPDALVENYKNNGVELYNNVDNQINALEKVIGSKGDMNTGDSPTLYGTLNLMTKPDMLQDEATKLKIWYDQAIAAIDTTYNSWSEADKVSAESVITDSNPHPEKNQTESINSETENLVKSIQSLASSSKETAQTTEEAAAKVKDISPDIQNLKDSTKRVETNANDILNNLDKTVTEVQGTTKDNSDYAEKFDKVLSNTKNGGADNKTVFNFLSNPIQDKGEFGETRQNSLIPYYATIIGVFISLFIAIGLQRYMKRRHLSKEDLLLNPSRAWYNLPNMVTALLIIGGVAIAFGLTLSLIVGVNSKIAWFGYAFLSLFAGTMLILGFIRQFRVLTLCLCGGILALFFMLTPLLGVATKSGTFINLLFRISPLQNIQNGFTALLNGGSIGWLSYLILVGLAVGGILLNVWVKPEETTSITK